MSERNARLCVPERMTVGPSQTAVSGESEMNEKCGFFRDLAQSLIESLEIHRLVNAVNGGESETVGVPPGAAFDDIKGGYLRPPWASL